MRSLNPVFLLVVLVGFSCSRNAQEPSGPSETLHLTNESLRKVVDLQINEAIFMDEQRGRKNEELVAKLKQLADSRKGLEFEDLSAIEAHVSILKSFSQNMEDNGLESSFDRVEEYLAKCQNDPKDLPLLKVEISNMEFTLVEHLSRQMGMIDCCFPSPMKVQINTDIKVDEPFEIAIFPSGERALWEHVSYSYEDVYVEQAGKRIPALRETRRIGHVLILELMIENSGEYVVHFTVKESGDYLAEPWQQDFEWPVTIK